VVSMFMQLLLMNDIYLESTTTINKPNYDIIYSTM